MDKEFIPYDLVLILKELGFDEPCVAIFGRNNELSVDDGFYKQENYHKDTVLAPTYSQAFRWFREKYSLTWEHQFDDSNISLYVGEMAYPDNNLDFFKIIEVEYGRYNKAYEEAELECLKKLIEIFKNK